MKETIIALVIVAILAVFWGTQYVAPKSRTLDAAALCTIGKGYRLNPRDKVASKVFDQCLIEAEAQHGTALLQIIGY